MSIPDLPPLEYKSEYQHHWIGALDGVEIWLYGDQQGPQSERIAIAQKIVPILGKMEIRAQIDLDNFFNGTGPKDEWTLLMVCFGFLGTEPNDEFSFHFGLGIWDWSTNYYAQYKLNSEYPEQSTRIGLRQTRW